MAQVMKFDNLFNFDTHIDIFLETRGTSLVRSPQTQISWQFECGARPNRRVRILNIYNTRPALKSWRNLLKRHLVLEENVLELRFAFYDYKLHNSLIS